MNENQALELRDNARTQLLAIKTVESGMEYLNKVKAIEIWVKAEKKDAELQNMIAEQKIRTQRILGQLIKDGQERKEIASQSEHGRGIQSSVPYRNTRNLIVPQQANEILDCTTVEQSTINAPGEFIKPKTLSDIGITRKESSTFQAISSIPEQDFNEYIEEKKQNVDNAVSELTTAGIVAFAKGKPHVSNNSGENEWYTPSPIIELARSAMGSIDTDPASSATANKTVKAKNYYTIIDNGLIQPWNGNVWLNPPYSQPQISEFTKAVVEKRKEYNQLIILVNNATETAWFQSVLVACDAVCFLKSRIKFNDSSGIPANTPLQGQALLYFGETPKNFMTQFNTTGICLTRMI